MGSRTAWRVDAGDPAPEGFLDQRRLRARDAGCDFLVNAGGSAERARGRPDVNDMQGRTRRPGEVCRGYASVSAGLRPIGGEKDRGR